MSALRGDFRVPGDKSISHRALLLGALARGENRITGFLPSGDCLATLACIEALGIPVTRRSETELVFEGGGLRAPAAPLDCVRSGTTMRLLAGMLAGQPFESVLTGDPQLLRRPMRRITAPLRRMGAAIEDVEGRAPLRIAGRRLRGCEHRLAVASAQVKSALLLAGLAADGETVVIQPGPARDHTERMLAAMGADLVVDGLTVRLKPGRDLAPLVLRVPGDLSSAAFPLVAALLLPGSDVTARGVGVNPTRTGLFDVLRGMGAALDVVPAGEAGGEPVADVTARGGELVGVEVSGDTVVRMIDEFPILAVAATQARGVTRVRDAAELRVKETDRIAVVAQELNKLGARVTPRPDGFDIAGPTPLHGGAVDSYGDHRLAMALIVAGLVAGEPVQVRGVERIADSFPGFETLMRALGGVGMV